MVKCVKPARVYEDTLSGIGRAVTSVSCVIDPLQELPLSSRTRLPLTKAKNWLVLLKSAAALSRHTMHCRPTWRFTTATSGSIVRFAAKASCLNLSLMRTWTDIMEFAPLSVQFVDGSTSTLETYPGTYSCVVKRNLSSVKYVTRPLRAANTWKNTWSLRTKRDSRTCALFVDVSSITGVPSSTTWSLTHQKQATRTAADIASVPVTLTKKKCLFPTRKTAESLLAFWNTVFRGKNRHCCKKTRYLEETQNVFLQVRQISQF